MIAFSIGIPGKFADWCDTVLARIVQHLAGDRHQRIHANSLDEIAQALIKSNISQALVHAQKPKRTLRAAFESAGAPSVIALDDPRRSVAYAMGRYRLALAPAVRVVSESCGAIAELPASRKALVVHADQHGQDPAQTTAALIRHVCGVNADVAKIARDIGDDEAPAHAAEHDAPASSASAPKHPGARLRKAADWASGLSDRQRTIVDGALGCYAELFANRPFRDSIWSRELFFLGEKPSEPPLGAIDVTGRSRCLLFGPYMYLPSGSWAAHIFLGFDLQTSIPPLTVEIVVADQVVARKSFQPDSSGIFELVIDLPVESADNPVALKISNEKAAFAGRLALGQVVVKPHNRVKMAVAAKSNIR